MAGTVTGSSTVIKLVRKICKLVAVYGVNDLQTRATPEFKTAVLALVAACSAFEALDDFPGQVDATPPLRVGEDVDFG
jgi:hypothetical protein